MTLPSLAGNAGTIAGICLWAIAFFWGFSPQVDKLYNRLEQRLPEVVASVVGIVPLVCLGMGCEYVLDWSLGKSWGVSLGLLAAMGCGVYELGRRSGRSED